MAARTSQAHREITPPYARLQKLQQNLETAPSSSQASPSKWSRGVVRLADPPSGLAIHTVDDDEELDNPSPGGGDNDAEWDIESLPEHQARTQNTPRENIHPGLLIPLIQSLDNRVRKLEAEMEDQQSYNEQMTQTARQLQTAVCATVSERPPPVRKTGRTKPPASR